MRNWRPEGWEGEEQALPEDLIGAILQGDLHHLNKLFAERGRDQDAGAMIILGTIVRW
jgi:hypothetical protein